MFAMERQQVELSIPSARSSSGGTWEVGMCSDLVRHIQRMHPIDADQDHTLRRMIGWRVDQRLWVLLLSRTRHHYCAEKDSAERRTSRELPLDPS
jgi:hypothetical protein